jgi:hypothetical protein
MVGGHTISFLEPLFVSELPALSIPQSTEFHEPNHIEARIGKQVCERN